MKSYIALFALGLTILVSCKKDDPIIETPMTTENTEVLYSGIFMSSAHETSGTIEIQSDSLTTSLVFTNFKTDNGPDLRVYLSKDKTDNEFIDLGELKGIEGAFFYDLEQEIDFTEYSHVLIWCEDFSVLFGYTELQ